MATQAQIEANRRNAQKSTGPRTEEGKQAVYQNLARGINSPRVLTHKEDPADFLNYRQALMDDLTPSGPMEIVLAERIVVLSWQLARSVCFQAQSIDSLILKPEPPKKVTFPRFF